MRRFDSPKQIQKYDRTGTGGKQFGKAQRKDEDQQTWEKNQRKKDPVSDNGTVVCKKQGVPEIYDYYVTRVKNPLKRRQAMVAVSCN